MKRINYYLLFIATMFCLLLSSPSMAQWSTPATVASRPELVLLYSYQWVTASRGHQDLKIICKNITTDKISFKINYEVHFHSGEVERVSSENVVELKPGEMYDPKSVADWGGVYKRFFLTPTGGKYGAKERWFPSGKDSNGSQLYSAIHSVMKMQITDFVNLSQKEREEKEKAEKAKAETKKLAEDKTRKELDIKKQQEAEELERKEAEKKKQAITNTSQAKSTSESTSVARMGSTSTKVADSKSRQQQIKDEYDEVKRKSDEKYKAQIEAQKQREEDNQKSRERQEALVTDAVQTLAPAAAQLLSPVGEAVDNFLDQAVGKSEIPSFTMGIGKAENASYYNLKIFNFVVNTKYIQPTFGFGMHIMSYPKYKFTYSENVAPDGKFYPSNNEEMSIGKRLGLNIPFGLQGVIPLVKGETYSILSFNWEASSAINLFTSSGTGDHRIPDGDKDSGGVKKMTPFLPFIQVTGGVEINFSQSFGIGLSIGMSKIGFEETVTGYINNYTYKYQAKAVNNKHFSPIVMFKLFRYSY